MGLMGLDSAISGLKIAQKQLSVISTNIANVNTPGYTRKILPQSTVAVGGQAVGVVDDTILRQVDLYLEKDFWTQVSGVEALNTKATYLNRIQEFHGNPDAETSIAARLSILHDNFAALADSPDDAYLQRAVVDKASNVAGKINDFADLLVEMQGNIEDDISSAVDRVNGYLERIAGFNQEIKFNLAVGKTTAALEDSRDQIIRDLSSEMELSFFTRGDGVMVVQTSDGIELASDRAETLYFKPSAAGPGNYYPATLGGVYVGGNPATDQGTIDITQRGVGGNIGALLELRDDILPRQQAELDELAHKIALRFDQQGLRLFTGGDGLVPADTDPVPDPPGPLTPVTYVGFSSSIRVNEDILADNSLVQKGTASADVTVQEGSNEVIRRVLEFTFGETQYQSATGSIDLRSNGTGGVDMQEWLGIYSENIITGTEALSAFSDISALINSADGTTLAGTADQFEITFDDPRLPSGVAAQTITIDLSDADANYPIGGAINDALDQIIAEINNQIATMEGAVADSADFAAVASRGSYGELVIQSRANVTIAAQPASATMTTPMGPVGLEYLGLTEMTQTTTDPWFEVQVGNDTAMQVSLAPSDTETDLMAQLEYNAGSGTGIPGLYADMDAATGALTLRPGNDDSNSGPVFGGDLTIIGGGFSADGTGGSGAASGDTIIEALFGTADPIVSQTHDATNPFRSTNLGPAANIDTGITVAASLIDFAQKIINRQSEEVVLVEAKYDDEVTYMDMLETRLLDESGVNIEEELANLITIQNSFAAASRAVSIIDEMFDDLLASI